VTGDCPIEASDGHDFPRLIDERIPGVAAVIDDFVEEFENGFDTQRPGCFLDVIPLQPADGVIRFYFGPKASTPVPVGGVTCCLGNDLERPVSRANVVWRRVIFWRRLENSGGNSRPLSALSQWLA